MRINSVVGSYLDPLADKVISSFLLLFVDCYSFFMWECCFAYSFLLIQIFISSIALTMAHMELLHCELSMWLSILTCKL